MADNLFERPSIHVILLPGTNPGLYRWVEIGAEEEGVPCRRVESTGDDLINVAYEAANGSRFHVGVAVSNEMIALHEMHMPLRHAVLTFPLEGDGSHACRLMGANAARMIIHKPLHVDLTPPPPPFEPKRPSQEQREVQAEPEISTAGLSAPREAAQQTVDTEFLAKLIAQVVQKIQERGVA